MDMLEVLAQGAARLEELVREADVAAPVAACPAWTAHDLVTHLGSIHRWGHRRDPHPT